MGTTKDIKILVADDNFANRSLLQAILGKYYTIIQAKDGQEAWDKLEEESIDIALLDLVMPNIDGFTLLDAIHRHDKYKQIPVVIITANDDKENQIKALDFGAVDILGKPFDPEIVIHRIQNVIDRINLNEINVNNAKLSLELAQKMDILELSQLDKTTGVYNRETFSSILSELLFNNPDVDFDLIRIDVDHFKVFNDTFGVAAGDAVLQKIGKILQKVHSRLTIYGRWHADHFVICTPRDNYNPDKLIKAITSNLQKDYKDFDFVIRAGIIHIEDPSLDPSILCDRAMLALKTLKDSYSNHIAYYDETMRKELLEEQNIINEMENALANHEFQVYIQPQYNYATHRLSGAEALVRWIHPVKGVISPGVFIPVFEKNGFITKLDEYIWEEACRLQKNWYEQGLNPVPVSVNISRRDIFNPDLCSILCNLVKKYEIPIELIRLEITESACIDDPDQLIKIVEELKRHGFLLEMDDFGTGYSSLNTLKDVPVDILKLDMKFLGNAADQSNALKAARGGAILSSIVRMAGRLNLPIIAEGVETLEQADFLKSIGCLTMQGYYFARPIPALEYEQLLKTNPSQIDTKTEIPGDSAFDFLDFSAKTTDLFNNYTGGSAIVEYTPETYHIEFLRMNQNFLNQLNLTPSQVPPEKDFKKAVIGSDGVTELAKLLDEAITSESETVGELKFERLNETVYVFARARRILDRPLSHLFFLNIENITSRMRLIEENERLRKEIEELKAGN